MNGEEKLHTREIYVPTEYPELMKKQSECLDLLFEYNSLRPSETEKKTALLKKMFAEIGEGCYIETPFHANFGKNIYANFNLTLVDDTHIYVGDNTMFGPNVTLATAGHPVLPELREKGYQFNIPIHIGKNCWIGAGSVILPGVTVGDGSVIGAGSVVTKDIPSGVVAVGNPCRVLRKIGDRDREYYYKDLRIPPEKIV